MGQATIDRDGSDLCLQCGICCHGVLHDYAIIDRSEIPSARSLGLNPVEHDAGRAKFDLPCRHVCGAKCTVYARRPSACSIYECSLLVRYKSGAVEPSQAHGIVAEARRLLDQVRATLRPNQTLPQARLEWQRQGMAPPAPSADAARDKRHRLSMTLLHLLIDRQFMLPHETKELTAEDVSRKHQAVA